MQRKKVKIEYPNIKPHYPKFFWTTCRFCGNEFKKENGYRITDIKKCRRSDEEPLYTYYCCSLCASGIEEVKDKIEKENVNILNKKPPRF